MMVRNKLVTALIVLAVVGGTLAEDCQNKILGKIENVWKSVDLMEGNLSAADVSDQTVNLTTATTPVPPCLVPPPIFLLLSDQIKLTLIPAKSDNLEGSDCALVLTPDVPAAMTCKAAVEQYRCGVKYLKAVYANALAIETLEQNERWEHVVSGLKKEMCKVVDVLKAYMGSEARSDLDVVCLRLADLEKTVTCLKSDIRVRMQKNVVGEILARKPESAIRWFKGLRTGGELLCNLIDRVYYQVTGSEAEMNIQRVANALKIIKFLQLFVGDPHNGAEGMRHLINGMSRTGSWPNLYLDFKELQTDLAQSSVCLTPAAHLTLYTTSLMLKDAVFRYVSSIVKFINVGNPEKAKDTYLGKIGEDNDAFQSIITRSYLSVDARNYTKDNVERTGKIIRFLELFNSVESSTEGLNALYDAVRQDGNNVIGVEVFQLGTHYKNMNLTDKTLQRNLHDGVNNLLDLWGADVLNSCDNLTETAKKYSSEVEAYAHELIYRSYGCSAEPFSKATKFADCIEKLPSYLQTVNGYGGLLKKLDDMGLVDYHEYMDLVQRFKNFANKHRPLETPQESQFRANIKNERPVQVLPTGIQNFFFGSNCALVNVAETTCLAIPYEMKKKWLTTNYYTAYLDTNVHGSSCQIHFSVNPASAVSAEYKIESSSRRTFLYMDSNRAYFWGHPEGKSSDNSWFKVKPHNRGEKFTFNSTLSYNGYLLYGTIQENDKENCGAATCVLTEKYYANSQKVSYKRGYWSLKCSN